MIKAEIEKILKKYGERGLSITELVDKSNLSRFSVRIELAKLEGANRVNIRRVGMAKLYYLAK